MKFVVGWLTLAAAGAVFARAQSATPAIHDAKDIEVGRGMFRIYCAACHGIQARGGLGPDLTRGVYNSGDKDSDLVRTISQGVPGTEMTGFEGTLSAESIHRIVAFIRSVSRPDSAAPQVGDPARGEALFWGKGSCGQCHTVNAKGARFGPDLSRVGRQRSYAYLREAILDPDRDITEGYRTLTVVLPDGRKITGLERGLDNFTAQLTDASGKFYSFDKSQVRSVRLEMHSLMPGNYGTLLTPAEIDDLLAYLSGLPRKP